MGLNLAPGSLFVPGRKIGLILYSISFKNEVVLQRW